MGQMPSIISPKQQSDGLESTPVGSGEQPAIEEVANNVEHDYPDPLYDIDKVCTYPLTLTQESCPLLTIPLG